MPRVAFASLLLLLALLGSEPAVSGTLDADVDRGLRELGGIANGWPPSVRNAEERANAEKLWRDLETRLRAAADAEPEDYGVAENVLRGGPPPRQFHIEGRGKPEEQFLIVPGGTSTPAAVGVPAPAAEPAPGVPAPVGATAPAADTLRDNVAALRALQPEVEKDYERLPAGAPPLLRQLRRGLRDVITAVIVEHAGRRPDVARLTAEITRRLAAAGVAPGGSDGSELGFFGFRLDRDRRSGLLAATTWVETGCGSDASLYVFEERADLEGPSAVEHPTARWELVLARETRDFERFVQAASGLVYRLSPRDPNGRWYVLVSDANPWWMGGWRSLRFAALAPGADPDTPVVLLEQRRAIFIATREPMRLTAESGGFSLDFTCGQGLEPAILTRPCTLAYRFEAGAVAGVARVPPLARTPEDFAAEWFTLPWSEAARWSDPAHVEELADWHRRQQQPWETTPQLVFFEFVQRCPGRPRRWQIGIHESRHGDDHPMDGPLVVLTITQHGDVFTMQSIDRDRPPGCPGEEWPRRMR